MCLDPDVFWKMSLRDFQLAQRGFFEREKTRYQTGWEMARFTAFYSVAPHAKEGKLKRPTDLVRFSWDAPSDVELPTKEYMEYMARKMGRFMKDGEFVN